MGLIMVIGIVAKNGILLLDADQKFRAEGVPAEQSMIQAGERRLRPIMMTALATVAGIASAGDSHSGPGSPITWRNLWPSRRLAESPLPWSSPWW